MGVTSPVVVVVRAIDRVALASRDHFVGIETARRFCGTGTVS
jgi:hypothetical protein